LPHCSYTCRFDGSGGSQLTTTAVPLVNSTSVMVCLAPNWGAVYAAETVSVNVLYVDRVLDGNLLYTFFDMVSSIDTATTSSMGGLSLTVRGAGFNATALYKCIFVGGADSMTTDATVTSVSVAECLVPDWGAVYKAQTVNVNLLLRSPTTTTQHHTSHHHATPQNTRHTTTPHHTTRHTTTPHHHTSHHHTTPVWCGVVCMVVWYGGVEWKIVVWRGVAVQ